MTVKPTIGSIVLQMEAERKIDWDSLTKREEFALKNIMICHTAVCGCVAEVCEHCGHFHIHYGSCNCSVCPQCGHQKSLEWAAKQKAKVVNAPYFHIIMTVPDEKINPLAERDPSFLYSSVMSATADTLKKFSMDPKYLGGKPGFFTSLHTWGGNLMRHIHTHTVFCGAVLDKNGNLRKAKPNYLFPVKDVANEFRDRLLKKLKAKYGDDDPLIKDLESVDEWNTEIRVCEGGPEHAIEYTARYINRTAISNGRIISYENGKVRFKYKKYNNEHEKKRREDKKLKKDSSSIQGGAVMAEMELEDTEFLRRFLMHIPPARFVRTRHYGFLSNSSSKTLKKIQELTGTVPPANPVPAEPQKPELTEEELMAKKQVALNEIEEAEELGHRIYTNKCPKCGHMALRGFKVKRAIMKDELDYGRMELVWRARDKLFNN